MYEIRRGSASPKPINHYGRGGAGNTTVKPEKSKNSPSFKAAQTTPTLKGKVYSTGRGGTGNMAKNDYGEEARVSQDVDVPRITLPEGHHHTGRGGAGNILKPTNEELEDARAHNKKVRTESFGKATGQGRHGESPRGERKGHTSRQG